MAEYLDSYPEPEPSGVNKFLKGLGELLLHVSVSRSGIRFFSQLYNGTATVCPFPGNKMKLLQIK